MEEIHWKFDFADISPPGHLLWDSVLPVCETQSTLQKIQRVIDKFKLNRASGPDAVPGEIWRYLSKDEKALNILLIQMNLDWKQKKIPGI